MSTSTKDVVISQWRAKLGDALDGSGSISTCLTLYSTFDAWNSEYAAHAPHKLKVPSAGVSDGVGVGDTFRLELAATRHLVVELWSDEAISLFGLDGRLAATELVVQSSNGSLRHSPLSEPEQRRLSMLLKNLGREHRCSKSTISPARSHKPRQGRWQVEPRRRHGGGPAQSPYLPSPPERAHTHAVPPRWQGIGGANPPSPSPESWPKPPCGLTVGFCLLCLIHGSCMMML